MEDSPGCDHSRVLLIARITSFLVAFIPQKVMKNYTYFLKSNKSESHKERSIMKNTSLSKTTKSTKTPARLNEGAYYPTKNMLADMVKK